MDHMFYKVKLGLEELKGKVVWPKLYAEEDRINEEEERKIQGEIRNRVEAIEEGNRKEGWVVYTDASISSYRGGCAVLVEKDGLEKDRKLGENCRLEVMTLEIKAVKKAIEMIWQIDTGKIKIRTDCKKIVEKVINKSEVEEDIKELYNEIGKLWREKRREVVVQWCPGHAGVEGNEKVNQLARETIDKGEEDSEVLQMRDLKVKLKEMRDDKVDKRWRESGYLRPLKYFQSRKAIKKFLDKKPGVATVQLMTGHCILNSYLHRMVRVRENGKCTCKKAEETIKHYLYECERYECIRKDIWKKGIEEVRGREFRYLMEINYFIWMSGRFKQEMWRELRGVETGDNEGREGVNGGSERGDVNEEVRGGEVEEDRVGSEGNYSWVVDLDIDWGILEGGGENMERIEEDRERLKDKNLGFDRRRSVGYVVEGGRAETREEIEQNRETVIGRKGDWLKKRKEVDSRSRSASKGSEEGKVGMTSGKERDNREEEGRGDMKQDVGRREYEESKKEGRRVDREMEKEEYNKEGDSRSRFNQGKEGQQERRLGKEVSSEDRKGRKRRKKDRTGKELEGSWRKEISKRIMEKGEEKDRDGRKRGLEELKEEKVEWDRKEKKFIISEEEGKGERRAKRKGVAEWREGSKMIDIEEKGRKRRKKKVNEDVNLIRKGRER